MVYPSKTIAISLTEGRVIRDLFENGLIEKLISRGIDVQCFTPAARVPQFVNQWQTEGLYILPMNPYQITPQMQRAFAVRKRALKLGPAFFNQWSKFERRFFPADQDAQSALQEENTALAVITHPMFHGEMGIFQAAQALKIPTLGILRSWDNLYKGLRIRPDILAVWNCVNQEEAVRMMHYLKDRVPIVGGTQFDPYFAEEAGWSREKFCRTMDLDPHRPILTLATLGSFLHQYDETYMMDFLVESIMAGKIPGDPQLVCRLHPSSKLEYFLKYQKYPFVRLSYISDYIPSLAWTMTKKDVIWMANLLRHSDVVVSPGSTITIETAIFDTPTVVPIFHTYQPDQGEIIYGHHLSTHFRRLKELDFVPFVSSQENLILSINRFLREPEWYKNERKQLVNDYIQFTDGRSTERLLDLIIRLVNHEPAA